MIRSKKKKALTESSPENSFWANNGYVSKNLNELSHCVQNMDDFTFRYHLNVEKNDFAKWIKDALGDEEVASKLEKAKTKSGFLKILDNHIKKNYQL